ncbi:acyl carrier protein [Saccharothrix sp. NRRL B-16314]|uniref:acyl carrier protein n=1 Tax=Saccharothrix sp. NRRL B-16314 TaxID=1463825 RepID=UPI000525CF7F|nr:acyl carrier protein [Saccharothrix sp. NRRL B-16314]
MLDARFEAITRTHLPFVAEQDELHADLDLRSAGLDSVGMVTLLSELENTYGVRLPEDLLTESTFATLASLRHAFSTTVGSSEQATHP